VIGASPFWSQDVTAGPLVFQSASTRDAVDEEPKMCKVSNREGERPKTRIEKSEEV